jgi:sugar/nucleoside kinase (ribokinase family)
LNWDPAWGCESPARIEQRKSAVREVLPWVDLVHGNVRELGEFTNVGPDAPGLAVERLLQAGAGAVVLHMGAAGAGYFSRSEASVEPPAPVESPIRSTGTGDVLSVCMMLLHRRTDISTPDKLRLANQIVADYMEGRRELIPRIA